MVTYYSTLKKPKYKLVVLVDENSASASEILAGAVQDRKAGTVVGVPTYGKGTVQQIISLPKGDGMKLTIAEYLTPNKRNINGERNHTRYNSRKQRWRKRCTTTEGNRLANKIESKNCELYIEKNL